MTNGSEVPIAAVVRITDEISLTVSALESTSIIPDHPVQSYSLFSTTGEYDVTYQHN